MSNLKNKSITAILTMAVIFTGLVIGGCVTQRHIDELKAEIRTIKADNAQTNELVKKMDSLVSNTIESNNKLRNDVTFSNDQLQEKIDILLENYNELMAIIQQINQNMSTKSVLNSSPGIQTTPQTNNSVNNTPIKEPSIDCGLTYDSSFILVRQGEYEKAIAGFNLFLTECPDHQSVENAHYWIGESLYALEKYVEAGEKFQYVLDNFKASNNLSRALYQLARSKYELGKKDEAKATYQKIIDEYPDSFEASQAKDRLKDL